MASYSWGLSMTYKKLCREMFNCAKSSEQRAGAKLFLLGYLNGSSDASYIGLGRSKFKLMDLIPDDEFVKYNYIFFQTGLCDTLLDNFDADKFLNFLEQREDLSEYPLANSRMIFSRQELEDDATALRKKISHWIFFFPLSAISVQIISAVVETKL